MNYPDGMTRQNLIAVGEIEPMTEPVTRVAMVTVFLRYHTDNPEDDIMLATTPWEIGSDIVGRLRHGGRLEHMPTEVEFGDWEWLTPANAPNFGFTVSSTLLIPGGGATQPAAAPRPGHRP